MQINELFIRVEFCPTSPVLLFYSEAFFFFFVISLKYDCMCHAALSVGQLDNKLRSSYNIVYYLSSLWGQSIRLEGLFMVSDFTEKSAVTEEMIHF